MIENLRNFSTPNGKYYSYQVRSNWTERTWKTKKFSSGARDLWWSSVVSYDVFSRLGYEPLPEMTKCHWVTDITRNYKKNPMAAIALPLKIDTWSKNLNMLLTSWIAAITRNDRNVHYLLTIKDKDLQQKSTIPKVWSVFNLVCCGSCWIVAITRNK